MTKPELSIVIILRVIGITGLLPCQRSSCRTRCSIVAISAVPRPDPVLLGEPP